MTSLAAWVAVDQRGPASFYLASDSRITFDDGRPAFDFAKKLFASSEYADIFAYGGYADFPFGVLQKAQALMDGGKLFAKSDSATTRNDKFDALLKRFLSNYGSQKMEFTILHAARDGEGMSSVFSLWTFAWSIELGYLCESVPLPTSSALTFSAGSGRAAIFEQNYKWRNLLPRTSRSVFSAFCDALEGGTDLKTGGAPQLVGLFGKGPAEHFGLIYKGGRYLSGREWKETDGCDRVKWRNTLFELCDCHTMERIPSSQRHSRPKEL